MGRRIFWATSWLAHCASAVKPNTHWSKRGLFQSKRACQRGFCFSQAKELQKIENIDDETKSGFVSYLCVRTFGYVEASVKTILREYVRSNSRDIPTFNYVNINLRNLTPRRHQILELIGQFDRQWGDRLKSYITMEHGDSLNAIVVNRNEIAHGEDVDMSLRDLEQYYRHAREVVRFVFNICSS